MYFLGSLLHDELEFVGRTRNPTEIGENGRTLRRCLLAKGERALVGQSASGTAPIEKRQDSKTEGDTTIKTREEL